MDSYRINTKKALLRMVLSLFIVAAFFITSVFLVARFIDYKLSTGIPNNLSNDFVSKNFYTGSLIEIFLPNIIIMAILPIVLGIPFLIFYLKNREIRVNLEGDSLVIRNEGGIIKSEYLRIPYHNIRDVRVIQDPLDRKVGLAKVIITTTKPLPKNLRENSSINLLIKTNNNKPTNNEYTIPFLNKKDAEDLSKKLLLKVKENRYNQFKDE